MSVKLVNIESIGSYFESLSDPRHLRNRKHLLEDIIVISVCGMICGSDVKNQGKPWGHWAGLKICCDFAQIVCVSGFDHIGFGAE